MKEVKDFELHSVPHGYDVEKSVHKVDAEMALSQDGGAKLAAPVITDTPQPPSKDATAEALQQVPQETSQDQVPKEPSQDQVPKVAVKTTIANSPRTATNAAPPQAMTGPWTSGVVRWIGRQLVLHKYWDDLGVHVEEGKDAFAKNMTKQFVTESWLSNVVMQAYANEFKIAFINLTESNSQKGGPGATKIQLSLTLRGQIMPYGATHQPGSTASTIYTHWDGWHFGLLVPCPETDPHAEFEWDQEAHSTWFHLLRMPKDHACGYHTIAAALNGNGTRVPLEFQPPTNRFL